MPQQTEPDLRTRLVTLRRELIEDLEIDFPDSSTLALLSRVQIAIAAIDADAVIGQNAGEVDP